MQRVGTERTRQAMTGTLFEILRGSCDDGARERAMSWSESSAR